jgi:hypothetical protein
LTQLLIMDKTIIQTLNRVLKKAIIYRNNWIKAKIYSKFKKVLANRRIGIISVHKISIFSRVISCVIKITVKRVVKRSCLLLLQNTVIVWMQSLFIIIEIKTKSLIIN